MKVLEAKIIYESDDIEKYKNKICDIFYDMGVNGLKIEEPNFIHNPLDFYRNEKDFISSNYAISAYFPLNFYTEKRKIYLSEKLESEFSEDDNIIYYLDFYEYDEEDYQNSWKKYLFVEKVAKNFVIKPTWREYKKNENEILIEIDPGLAFGTGSHPTTALCLKFLEEMDLKNKSFIDIGTGSGILLIAANKLGVENLTGTDIDSVALDVARENLILNKVNINNVNLLNGDLLSVVENKKFDIVVANILSDVLINLLADIDMIVKQGSKILFSGIIDDKLELLKKKILNMNFKIIEIKEEKEWRAILFEKL